MYLKMEEIITCVDNENHPERAPLVMRERKG